MRRSLRLPAAALVLTLGLAACSSDPADVAGPGVEAPATTGIRVVSPQDAAAILTDAPAGLVVLDVRTAEEFAEGHLAGAVNVDFYAADFREQLAALDHEVPYVLYCRSGNRSSQARAVMADLGFVDVADVDGGIVAWQAAGLPTER